MPDIHEIATLTSKGQVTLPKSVRQLLGIDTGGKIAFDVRGGEIVVSREETTHERLKIQGHRLCMGQRRKYPPVYRQQIRSLRRIREDAGPRQPS